VRRFDQTYWDSRIQSRSMRRTLVSFAHTLVAFVPLESVRRTGLRLTVTK